MHDPTDQNLSTSPSVYVAYRGLQASAAYLPFGQNLGGGTHDVTVGYPPNELSTSHCNIQYESASGVQTWAPVNYSDLEFPLPNSLVTDCPRATNAPNVGGATYDPAAFNEMGNPFFSVPGNLTWVDPAWTQCIPVSYGIIDPPRKLDKTSAPLVAPTPLTTPTSPLPEAAPASSVAAPLPPVTSAIALDPGTSVSSPAAALVVNTAVAQNQGTNNVAAVTPDSNPTSTAVDPNDENAAQMSALHQALASVPAASPQATVVQPAAQPAQSVVEQNDGQVNAETEVTQPVGTQAAAAVKPAAAQSASAQPAAVQPAAQPTESVAEQNDGQVNAEKQTTTDQGTSGNTPAVVPAVNQNAAAASPYAAPASSPVVMANPSPVVIAGNTATPAANGGVILASSTYTPGSKATVAGKVYSVGSSVIQDENSQTYSIQPTPTPVLVAGNSIAKAVGGGVVVASSTYTPGAQAQVSGTSFSVGSDNIAVGSSTHALPASPSQTPVLVGDVSVSRASNGGIIVGSSTIAAGEQATVSNHVISAGPSNAVVDGDSYALATSAGAILQQAPAQQQAVAEQSTPVAVGGQSIQKAANGGVIIGDTTIAAGAQATVQNHVVSAGQSNVVVDGSSSYALPTSAGAIVQQAVQQQAPVLVGGQSINRASNGGVVIAGSTVAPDSQATIQGHVIAAGPANAAGSANVVIDGSTMALQASAGAVLQTPAPEIQAAVTIGGNSIARASNGGIVIGSNTLAPGSQTTVAGHVVSAGAGSSNNVVIDGSTQTLATSASAVLQTPSPLQAPVLIGGQSVARASNGAIVIGSSTFAPGTQATIDGHTISAAPNNDNVVVDGTTQILPTTAGAVLETPAPTQAPVLIGGESVTRASNGGLIIGTSTLPPDTAATIAGHTISANANSDNVIVDGTNYALPTTPGAILQTFASPLTTATPTPAPEPIVTLANGAVISAGGAAATISGLVASVLPDESGIVIGSTAYPMPSPSPTAAPSSIFTVGGQTFTAKPSGFVIAPGEAVMPGGPAVTLGGTAVSLDQAGDLQIGTSTIPLVASPTDGGYVAGVAYPSANDSSTIIPYEGGSPRSNGESCVLQLLVAFWLLVGNVVILL